MKIQDAIYFWFVLVLVGLLLFNYKGTVSILGTSASAANSLTRTLQGR